MFRGDLAHSGVYKAQGIPKFSQVKWKFHTDGQVISSPAVADGMVFVGVRTGTCTGLISHPARKNGSSSPGCG